MKMKCRVEICAYTGVSATLMGMGCETICLLFKINTRNKCGNILATYPLRSPEGKH